MRPQTGPYKPFAALALLAVVGLPLRSARAQTSSTQSTTSQTPTSLAPLTPATTGLAPLTPAPITPNLATPIPALKPATQPPAVPPLRTQTPAIPALSSQTPTTQTPEGQTPITPPPPNQTPAPVAQAPSTPPPTAPAPATPNSADGVAKMAPIDLATVAILNLEHADTLPDHYTFLKTDQVQDIMDGKLVVDHTTEYESLFIGGLPYLRRVAYDGQPLSEKDQKAEQKLYDKAVKDRTGLSPATRLALAKHASKDAILNYNRVPFDFDLKLDGHTTVDGIDCVVLDAVPLPTTVAAAQQIHLRLAIDPANLQVLDIHKEFLAANNGFDKGTVVEARYELHNGDPLLAEQTLDTVVRFKELMDKPIHVHQVTRYTNYRRFRATVTIEAVHELPPDEVKADPKAPPPAHPR